MSARKIFLAKTVLVVGAGLSGAVIARQLAEAGHHVEVVDARDHVGGNCHTRRDPETDILIHVYGPHIFHTDDRRVWEYVTSFARFHPFNHTVKTTLGDAIFTLPINLHTINQFFGTAMRPQEASAFIAERKEKPPDTPTTFEGAARAAIGNCLYEAFFRGYTEKQWGVSPERLPASVFHRLPLRFSYDDSYFAHRFQGIPEEGYTAMVAAMLAHPNITLTLDAFWQPVEASGYDHIFYSGPLDAYFEHSEGRLAYRTIDFEQFSASGDYQGCAVMNFADAEVPFTRVTEHKHFAPWECHSKTVLSREYLRDCKAEDSPFYPLRLDGEMERLAKYVALAEETSGVTFVGRLGTYRYLDMDVCVREALEIASLYQTHLEGAAAMPAFVHAPL